MSTPIQAIHARVDLVDLAARLGLDGPFDSRSGGAMFRSPGHDDRSPSLSVYTGKDGRLRWKDHSRDTGGDAIDLVAYVQDCDTAEAVRWLCDSYGIERERPAANEPRRDRTLAELIADGSRAQAAEAVRWLVQVRAIPQALAERAVRLGAVGWNVYHKPSARPGDRGYGGPACVFVVRREDGRVVGVDLRYADPDLNGGQKTSSQGEKDGAPWVMSWRALAQANTVVIVESAINALSVEASGKPGLVGLACRGTATVDGIDARVLRGKRVLIGMDNDAPDERGRCAGQTAGWKLHERLTGLGVACHLIDQAKWAVNDWNDILQARGPEGVKGALASLQPWAIAGLPGNLDERRGEARVWLPPHDFHAYWRFRVQEDFTRTVKMVDRKEKDGDGSVMDGPSQEEWSDLCGFRIAGLSRVTIQGATATMSGEQDHQPRIVFAAAVQTPQHGNALVRQVLEDHRLHNIDAWTRFGPVWSPPQFLRLVNILGRAAHIGAREAVNFVGLAWKAGRPVVNEGPDCYFTEPDKQCPYHGLQFPSGQAGDAARVIGAYQATFGRNAAAQLLVWALGGHLKAFLGFWPHMTLQADKGTGKSTLIKRLERSIGFQMLSGQSLQSEFRLLTSISHTSHPIGWEELSARRQEIIDKAVGLLQETYQYTVTRRGEKLTEFVLCAPVLLAGEDVPVRSLLGKVVRVSLRAEARGALMPQDLPPFPVRQWLDFLARQTRGRVQEVHAAAVDQLKRVCRARASDPGAQRMVENYAAVCTAWAFLTDFAGLPPSTGDFIPDLVAEMNAHIGETAHDREPWVWIVETLLAELAAGKYQHPHRFERLDFTEPCLLLRCSDVMHHIKTSAGLRDLWNGLPVKSDRVFKRQLAQAGVIHTDRCDAVIDGRRHSHLIALSLPRLETFGLHAACPEGL